jgi:enediyne biosynthesis protein E4
MRQSRLVWMRLLYILVFIVAFLPLKAQVFFEDVTASRGISPFNSSETIGSGVSAADFDNDGDIDMFVGTSIDQISHLYRNDGNGSFEDIAESVNLIIPGRVHSAIWFDYDGDHLLDLLVGGTLGDDNPFENIFIMLFKQSQNGMFSDVTQFTNLEIEDSGSYFGGAAAGDINNDGHLDLFISAWHGQRYIYLNTGFGKFTDITETAIGEKRLPHLQPLFYDINQDGWIDLHLNVDGQKDEFWINNKDNTFTNVAKELGLDSDFNEMGITLGDYDNDGDMEMYMSNINSVGKHNVFFKNESEDDRLEFKEIAEELGVGQAGWGWGVTFFDADNDGLLDLAATNGWTRFEAQESLFFRNTDGSSFEDVSTNYNYNIARHGTTLIAFDLERDGDLDMVESLKTIPDQPISLSIMENQLSESTEQKNYFVVKPRMDGFNHFAIGSEVEVTTGELTMIRPITAGVSFWGQEPAEAFFGLSNNTHIDEVKITWPNGETSVWKDFDANEVITLTDTGTVHAPINFEVTVDGIRPEFHWDDLSTNEEGFIIERSTTEDFEDITEFHVDANQRFYESELLPAYPSYYFRVKAYKSSYISRQSNSVVIENNLEEFIIAGIDDPIDHSKQLKLFPNPTQKSVTLLFDNEYYGEFEVSLISGTGSIISKAQYIKQEQIWEKTLQLNGSAGVYIVILTSPNGVITKKLIKVN